MSSDSERRVEIPDRLIVAVLSLSRSPAGDTQLTLARVVDGGRSYIPVFSSDEAFLRCRPVEAEGLILNASQLLHLLDPDETVLLDFGSPHATRWDAPEFVALLASLSGRSGS